MKELPRVYGRRTDRTANIARKRLDDANLVRNIEGIVVLGQTNICLLLAIGPDEGVDLGGVDVVHLFDGLLDLDLAGAHINNEHKCVVLLDLLHGRLGGEWVLEDLVAIETVGAGAVLARVLWVASLGLGLWLVESNLGTDLLCDSASAFGDGLCGFSGSCLLVCEKKHTSDRISRLVHPA